jgi:ABC-2 type transport system ATP-binding protein
MIATPDGTGVRVEVRNLRKSFGAVRAVDSLSFAVEAGRVTGFLGPNGAGKTTTLRILLGLVAADSGTATIGSKPYRALPAPTSTVGAALESTGFHPARSGRAHLRIYCTIEGHPLRRADEVLDLVGLAGAARRRVGDYSLGMRQRLALAAALLGDPRLLILDEPGNGLDPEGIAWLRRLLRDLAAPAHTVLVSSHVLSEVRQLVDHVVIIHKGRCVRQAPLAEISELDGPVVNVRTPHADELRAALTRAGIPAGRIGVAGPDRLRVSGTPPEEIGLLAYAASVPLLWLATEDSDLEQAFLALTGPPDLSPATIVHSGG